MIGTTVGVGEEGRGRVLEFDAGEGLAHRDGGLGHERGMGGHADRQDDRALGPKVASELRTGFDGGPVTRHDDLTRGVAVGHDERAVSGGRGDELGQPRVVEADERGHRPVTALPGRLHEASALPHEPHAVLERERTGRNERRVLAHRMPGSECRIRGGEAIGGPALAQRLEDGDGSGQQRGLGVLREVQPLRGPLPGERAERLAEGGIGRGEYGRGGRRGRGEIPAHAHGL